MGRLKIKRGCAIYGRRANPWKVAALVLIGLLAAGAITLFVMAVYSPLADYIDSELSGSPSSASSSVSVSKSSSSAPTSSSEEDVFKPVDPAELRAAYMPADQIAYPDVAALWLADVAALGYNAVVVDAKDAEGMLRYSSADTLAIKADAVSAGAGDMEEFVALARAENLTVWASVFAFEDHIVSLYDADMAILYSEDNSKFWLDAASDEGGRTWLNPYSDAAADYVCRVIAEVTKAGVSGILLDGVGVPTVPGSEYADYGGGADALALSDRLAAVVNRCRLTAEENGASLILCVPAAAALGTDVEAYGGVNPMSFGADYVMTDLQLEQFSEIVTGDGVIADPVADPALSLQTLVSNIDKRNETGAVLLVRLQGYLLREGGDAEAFLRAQKEAYGGLGVGVYIYEPAGLYT